MNLPREKILELVVESSTDILTLMSPTGEVLFESGAVKDIFGYEPQELVGKNALSLLHPMDLPGVLRQIAIGMANPGKQYRARFRFKTKSGEYVNAESTASYIIREDFKGVVVATRKYEEESDLEKKVVDLDEKYQGLFSNLPDAFALHEAIFDSEGKPIDYIFLGVNDAFVKMTGFDRDKVLGRKVTEILPGTEKDPFDWIGKYGKIAKDGGNFKFDQRSSVLNKWYAGRAYGLENNRFATIFTDVTEERTRASELEKLKMAIDNVTSHVVLTDIDGIIIYANSAAVNITGYTKEEMMGTKAGKLWSLPMPREFYEKLWKTIKVEKQSFIGEIINRRKNGQVYTAKVDIAPVLDSAGVLIGFVGVEDDITDQKKTEKELNDKFIELERLNSLMIGREIKMAELKKQLAKNES